MKFEYIYFLIFLLIENVFAQFILNNNNLKIELLELTVDELNNNQIVDSFNYFVKNDECSNNEIINKDVYLAAKNFKAYLEIYEKYNNNVGYFLNTIFESPETNVDILAYEIQIIKNYGTNEKHCLRILSKEINFLKNKKFSISLKDPLLFEINSHNFAHVSIHSLTKCNINKNALCSVAKTDNINVQINFPIYQPEQNICYNSSIYDSCVQIYNANKNQSFIFMMHSIPDFIDIILNKLTTFDNREMIINSYKDESKYGYNYKLIKVQNQNYMLSSIPFKPSKSNFCYSKNNNNKNKFCHCNNTCIDCYYENVDTIPNVILLNQLPSEIKSTSSKKCSSNPYNYFKNLNIRDKFLNMPINETYGYHLNDYLPDLCTIIKNSTEQIHLYENKKIFMELKLTNNHQLLFSDDFNIKYKIKITDIKNLTNIMIDEKKWSMEEEINYSKSIFFEKKYYHEYNLEIIPIINSNICLNMCPYIKKNEIENKYELSCEECKSKNFILTNQRDDSDKTEWQKCQL